MITQIGGLPIRPGNGFGDFILKKRTWEVFPGSWVRRDTNQL